ncbi:MAG: sigma 54-interacting transcriptional regulator [Terrisporobacter othiniensis]|uniref:Sigma 54-interacting transcriptional regulator n=3 Tax=Terrisporobacter hibernicus TaxID=2813371 RepID=A0AAX2ZIY4_9FIRM|nr:MULTISPECIES: sigma 54-interacting transcriptional regulator [Terrisporobacter]MDU4862189.1 sigma 54-interacting transcriptional regulator [Terrisporobacter othiniensis]MDU6995849.1 sigma 54-interacting transcriptional regulator [Terrisporobacter othiniensis]UEL49278.1 sigma 54-interacting transcriptional regulator [Terrisporobacter hibernicus]
MNGLKDIKDDIQNIAEAMLSVLNIDVTIVDEELVRIAGTGIYLDKIGERVNGYSAFKKCLEEQVLIYIDDSEQNDICKICSNNGNCKEYAEVCCPITLDGYSYGVVGLIAFNEEQSSIITDNAKDLTNFLGKMADLISNKLKAQNKTEELELEKKKLEILLNGMNKAVVSIDTRGNIDKYNVKFRESFNIDDEKLESGNIFDLLDFIKKPSTLDFEKYKTGIFYYKKLGRNLKGIYNISQIVVKNKLKGYVIDFIENKEAIKNYNKINKDYKITLDNIVGSSEIMEHTKQKALIAAKSNSTVLITGESGTGKELFARAIHNHSDRTDYPFVAVNCAAIPDNLLESELFGYEEGAFTGAKKGGKLGKFELAHNGTIFLDEIGDMSLHLQGKLLRVLQERELDKIGGKSNIFIDVRVIAATNKNLEELVRNGQFREDLYYRLKVIPITLPTLRERKSDIPLLIDYMIKEYARKLNKDVIGIEEDASKTLVDYTWPGNVRELQNIIEYSINMSNSTLLTLDIIPNNIKSTYYDEKSHKEEEIRTLEDLEKEEIRKAFNKYKHYKKDKELVAKALGISRATLYRKLEKYNLISK